jgi:CRISPR/Cas system-associated exonuclease Cas4 (RecB family)
MITNRDSLLAEDFPNEPARFSYTSAGYKRDWDTLKKLADEILRYTQNDASTYPLTDDRTNCSYCPYRSYCDRRVRAGY